MMRAFRSVKETRGGQNDPLTDGGGGLNFDANLTIIVSYES
jgi:hypothetical protein